MNEKKLFKLIKTKLIPDLCPTSEYYPKDGYSPKLDLLVELKCRKKHYDTLMIEKPKYDALITSGKARYIVSTPEGIFSFNIKKLKNLEWFVQDLPTSTMFIQNIERVDKTVAYLNIKDAKNITNILLSK